MKPDLANRANQIIAAAAEVAVVVEAVAVAADAEGLVAAAGAAVMIEVAAKVAVAAGVKPTLTNIFTDGTVVKDLAFNSIL